MVLRVPWQKPPSKRRREIIVPKDARPIRAETRAKLVASIAHGRRWLDEIVAGTAAFGAASTLATSMHSAPRSAADGLIGEPGRGF